MDPRHSSEILDALPSLEDLAIVLNIDFADIDALCTALRWRDRILVFLV
jgi:hypothetical protein